MYISNILVSGCDIRINQMCVYFFNFNVYYSTVIVSAIKNFICLGKVQSTMDIELNENVSRNLNSKK